MHSKVLCFNFWSCPKLADQTIIVEPIVFNLINRYKYLKSKYPGVVCSSHSLTNRFFFFLDYHLSIFVIFIFVILFSFSLTVYYRIFSNILSLSGRCVFFSKTGDSNAEDEDVCRALSPNFSEFVQNV